MCTLTTIYAYSESVYFLSGDSLQAYFGNLCMIMLCNCPSTVPCRSPIPVPHSCVDIGPTARCTRANFNTLKITLETFTNLFHVVVFTTVLSRPRFRFLLHCAIFTGLDVKCSQNINGDSLKITQGVNH